MKKLGIFFLILAIIPIGYALYYQDIFEDFINSDNVTAINQLIVNGTVDALGFNMSETMGDFVPEDTGDYTWVDVDSTGGTINETSATRVFIDAVDRDETEYFYRDMGAGYFDDFQLNYTLQGLSRVGNPQVVPLCLANNTGEFDSVGDLFACKLFYSTAQSKFGIQIWIKESGVYSGTSYYISANPFTAYITMNKLGSDVWLEIYSDSARTTLLQNMTKAFTYDPAFRYVHWGQSDDDALGGRSISAYVDDLTFQRDGYLSGYMITPNLFNGISDDATALLVNTSIPEPANITVQISENNSTWVNSQGVSGFDDLENGTRAINLEALEYNTVYLMWNFTRTNGTQEVLVYDYKLIYESTCSGAGGVGVLTCVNHTAQSAVVATIQGNQTESGAVDGDWLNITEVVGTPAFDARFNYTIPDNAVSIGLRLLGVYDGNIGHNVTIEAYNFSSGAWVILDQIPDGSTMTWFNNSISAFNQDDFVQDNVLMIRIYHYSAGNINHHVHIDFMQVCYLLPTTGAGTPLFLHWIFWVMLVLLTTIIILYKRRVI